MTKEITLFPHNEKGYNLLVEGLKDYPLAFIEHATGTGKSFIILKYLYNHQKDNRILFISMHDEMFVQLFGEQMSTLNMSRKEFKTFDTLIYPNILKYDMSEIIKQYDCIVLDEAHHCGASKWSVKIQELKDLVKKTPRKVMIGATATSIRYLDDYRDVSEEYFDSHVVSRLPISRAILENLLPAPLYINSLAACQDQYNRILRKINKLPLTKEIREYKAKLEQIGSKVEKESRIPTVLKKYDVKPGEKYIIFCKDINDLTQKKEDAASWFKEIGPIKTFTAHSGQTKDINNQEIASFGEKRDEISLMFAVDMFNEGFHIDGVDGIIMFRKTKSPIIYFQQIGRALSFSVRKKQIKIFDFVDNISENEVIYELYKELLKEAKRLVKENPQDKSLYDEIISRFQIIDETTQIIDELNDIEKYLDENYISRGSILFAINKLEEYRGFYPHTDFIEELKNKRIAPDYHRAYNFICRSSDELTTDLIAQLQRLNIPFGQEIDMPLDERTEKLKGYKNFAELNEAEYNTFVSNYISFCNANNRRPAPSIDDMEQKLYEDYRKYLNTLSTPKLNKLIKKFTFPSTIEEIVLTGNYPNREMIEKYINELNYKVNNNQPLDEIELKVMKRIQKMVSIKDMKLLSIINSYDSINAKIEQAIVVITEYKEKINPQERFTNIDLFIGEKALYQALQIIHKHATHITTPQFERLLALDIELPKSISMTLEERKAQLGEYQSFYQKEKERTKDILDKYISFIEDNNRRPSKQNKDEQELALKYENYITRTKPGKISEVCKVLEQNEIRLSFFETIMGNRPIDSKVIQAYIKIIDKRLHDYEPINTEDLKCLRTIKRNYNDIPEVDYLIAQITNINDLNIIIDNIKTNQEKGNQFEIRHFINLISNHSKFITKKHLEKLKTLNIKVNEELEKAINALPGCINLYEKEHQDKNSLSEKYQNYLLENKRRPDKNSPLEIEYRAYIATLSQKNLALFINIIEESGLPFTFEEKVLLGYRLNNQEIENYLQELHRMSTLQIPLDSLEARVIKILRKKGLISIRFQNLIKENRLENQTESLEKRIVDNLRESISRNPEEPINYANTLYNISSSNKNRLEQYRAIVLSRTFIPNILKTIKEAKAPLIDCLTIKEYSAFNRFKEYKFLDPEINFIIEQILSLDREYRFQSKGVNHNEFINLYITFIVNHDGRRPSIGSTDQEEQNIATSFNEIKSELTKQDLSRINNAVKEAKQSITADEFYTKFYDFIIANGRFPCGNSNIPEEVELNNLYVLLGSKLSKEQLIELRKLKKTYSQATIQANLEFSKLQQVQKKPK